MSEEMPKEWCIILKFQTDPWQLSIEGDVSNGDMALAMLDQARRKVEWDMRTALSVEAQMTLRKKLEEEARVSSILNHGRRQ